MSRKRLLTLAAVVACSVLMLGACGSSKPKTKPAGGSSEAQSAATGDIPDNQAFLTYRDRASGYFLSYPEGWARSGGGRTLTFRDKGNSVHLQLAPGSPPLPVHVRSAPKRVSLRHGPAVKLVYTRTGAPDPVTGKRPLLVVDRYVYRHAHAVATLDLSTPKGVDNVDAYRMIANSFRWR